MPARYIALNAEPEGGQRFRIAEASKSVSRQKLTNVALVILSVVMLSLNVALAVQNRRLKAEVAVPQALLPQSGKKVQKLEGVGLDGSRMNLQFDVDRRKTLLFIFSTTCGICDINWPAWKSIQRTTNVRQYRLVYANIRSSLPAIYLSKHDVYGEVIFADLDPRSIVTLNLTLTPLTVLLGSDGTIENVWPGLLEGDELTRVRSLLAHE